MVVNLLHVRGPVSFDMQTSDSIRRHIATAYRGSAAAIKYGLDGQMRGRSTPKKGMDHHEEWADPALQTSSLN
jgi:hypothetical protein